MFSQFRHHVANVVVDRRNHGRENPASGRFDIPVPVCVLGGCLKRRVGGVRSQHQEESLVLVPTHEVHGLLREHIRQVFLNFDLLKAVKDRVGVAPRSGCVAARPRLDAFPAGVDVRRSAGEHPVVLVEAAIQRVVLFRLSEVPLADQSRRVARALEHVGDGALVSWQSDYRVAA